MGLEKLVKLLPEESGLSAQPRPYINHSVEFKKAFSAAERARKLDEVGLNVFFYPSEMVTGCDLLSDSGTTSMTSEQWAALHLGDEAYGSNRGHFILMERIRGTFGEEFFNNPSSGRFNAFIFHQGRSCENAIFTAIGKLGSDLVIPSNGHFDTTQGNIEANKIKALNLFSPELKNPDAPSRFKGNMDVERLKKVLDEKGDKVPVVFLTITNNTGGGQPVSMKNIEEVSEICGHHDIPLFFDACRFAENAWFIKRYEKKYANRSIPEIVREMFSNVDGFTISFKKDGIVNMGGGLFLRDRGLFVRKYPHMPDELTNHQIVKEGHPTYGGLTGRDIMALAKGLEVAVKDEYLGYRINEVTTFGEKMTAAGIEVLRPIGGHAVYLDVDKFFEGTHIKPEDFGGISLTAVLLAAYGHRACELGYFAFGAYDPETGKETLPEVNFVRLAVPRLRYEEQDLASVVEAVKCLYESRDAIPAVDVTYGRELPLRHFKARFEFRT